MSYTRLNPKYEMFDVTYGAGVSSANASHTHYERYGKIVHITAPLSTSQTKAKGDIILTIPAGYRPAGSFYFQYLNNGSVKNADISPSNGVLALEDAWSSAVLWLDAWYISE